MKALLLAAFLFFQQTPIVIIRNLEYVTVKTLIWKSKETHVEYLILRDGCYYYPNMSPVQVINYKVKGSPEVKVK